MLSKELYQKHYEAINVALRLVKKTERLGIRHVKAVVYRPRANRTERVNRDLVQMIAKYVNVQHDTWDQFLREFAYAIRTAVNETTGKPPAELFLGRKLITPFQKLVMVSDETEFAVGDIERLFEEARRNTKAKHEKWETYYNRRRRDVQIKVRIYRHRKCAETEIRTGSSDNVSLRGESSGFDRVQQRSNESQDGIREILSSNDSNVLPICSKKRRTQDKVEVSVSRYNLRPRGEREVESRPAIERKTQQGGPVRSRNGRGRNDKPYIEERTRSSKRNARRGGDQQQQVQERKRASVLDRGSCPPGEVSCANKKRCIINKWVCDGEKDCEDGSDELDCGKCSYGQFRCNDKVQCINSSWVCNRVKDCRDGSDETFCDPCPHAKFRCSDEVKCVNFVWVCNGKKDCRDGSDERFCGPCSYEQFRCIDGIHCINSSRVCDGNKECPDGSDETKCVASGHQHFLVEAVAFPSYPRHARLERDLAIWLTKEKFDKLTTEEDMTLRRFRRQYKQVSQFERGRIIGMMKTGWSSRRVAHHIGCSDYVVRRSEWNQVVFSDESRFNLSSDENRVRVWRTRDERFNPAFALQRHTAPATGVMVWGDIAYNTWSPLVLISRTMMAQRYVHDILEPRVLPLNQWLPGAVFQQDNARPHTARLSPNCYYNSLACSIPRFVSNRAYLGSFGTVSWAFFEFERSRGKVTTNMERNVSRHHAELIDVLSIPGAVSARGKLFSWFMQRRKSGSTVDKWSSQLPRVAVALYLANASIFSPGNTTGQEISYELTIQLLHHLSKYPLSCVSSRDKKMSSQELAFYIHAMLVACMDPRDFYGLNLVQELRKRTEANANYTNPFQILVLCNAGDKMTTRDVDRVKTAYDSQHRPFWTDTQALASLALACLMKKSNIVTDERILKDMLQELKQHQFRNGTVDNLKTTALVMQALLIHDSFDKGFDGKLAIQSIFQSVSGNVTLLNAYYALPALTGNSLFNVSSSHCRGAPEAKAEAWEKVLNVNAETISVQFSVWFFDKMELARTWRFAMHPNNSVYDVIESIAKSDYRQNTDLIMVEYNVVEGKPFVTSLGGIEDDPERETFWFVHLRNLNSDSEPELMEQSPVDLKLKPNQEIILWYKPAPWSTHLRVPTSTTSN
ncbi:low-density lipoprotein receptor-related protein 2 [Trichonephila clavipes]|nr:low-density lipoprotein receptor-related protein 2 [Trichonephila clavipes]